MTDAAGCTCQHEEPDHFVPKRLSGCNIHVDCDEGCQALQHPVTLAETQAALEHWENHSWVSGCSHGC